MSAADWQNKTVIERMRKARDMSGFPANPPQRGNAQRDAMMNQVIVNHNTANALERNNPARPGADLVQAYDWYREQHKDIAGNQVLNAAMGIMNIAQEQAHDEREAKARFQENAARLKKVMQRPEVMEYLNITPPMELAQAAFDVPMDPTDQDIVGEMAARRKRGSVPIDPNAESTRYSVEPLPDREMDTSVAENWEKERPPQAIIKDMREISPVGQIEKELENDN